MKRVNKIDNQKMYLDFIEILTIANSAVKKAKEENFRLGIPNTFWKNGNVYYVLPNGNITTTPPDIMTKN